jgi:RNA polymerase sigma-70 factor, ECF subfamily
MEMIGGTAGRPESERDLIRRVLAGEREHFYELIRPHERLLFLSAQAVLQNEADSEEVVQEAVLKAFRHLKEFRGDSKFSTWLVRIVLNEARMRVRKDRTGRYRSLDDLCSDENETGDYTPLLMADWREVPIEFVERNEVREKIAACLSRLPEGLRAVVTLRDIEQFSASETASALGISVALVKVRLYRARLRLRDMLAPWLKAHAGTKQMFKKGRNPWL